MTARKNSSKCNNFLRVIKGLQKGSKFLKVSFEAVCSDGNGDLKFVYYLCVYCVSNKITAWSKSTFLANDTFSPLHLLPSWARKTKHLMAEVSFWRWSRRRNRPHYWILQKMRLRPVERHRAALITPTTISPSFPLTSPTRTRRRPHTSLLSCIRFSPLRSFLM